MATTVVNPATAQAVAQIPRTSAEETDAAIENAQRAFEEWRRVAPADRGRLLRRFAEAVDADREELARLEVVNSGHTVANARWEAGNVRDVLNYYSAAPERLFGRQIPVPGGVDHRALELPHADRRLGVRPRPGRGEHSGPKTG
jgi:acyl-CoA reductase-like NAD-dependent aldehyde dehydrogenase